MATLSGSPSDHCEGNCVPPDEGGPCPKCGARWASKATRGRILNDPSYQAALADYRDRESAGAVQTITGEEFMRRLGLINEDVANDPTVEPWLEEARRMSEDGTFEQRAAEQTPVAEKIDAVLREHVAQVERDPLGCFKIDCTLCQEARERGLWQ